MSFPALCTLLLSTAGLRQLRAQQNTANAHSAYHVIAQMQQNLTSQWSKETVDTFKSGTQPHAPR